MTAQLILSGDLREQIRDEARAALPRECCGLIEGIREPGTIRAVALHPAANLARGDDRFEIDPVEQFRLMHALRGTGREIVGCYHSHPSGPAAPSPRDADEAQERDFVWLVAGVGARIALGAFVWDGRAFRELHLAQDA